jgi:hypothetical protein
MKRIFTFGMIALAVALVVPAFAADRVIYNGIDLWRTMGDGSTFADFTKIPIPAGFFCEKSEPFVGRIPFKGVPVATSVPGALGLTDTIVQRLDDATFNKNGVAFTRIQVRALNFESIAPVKTACGLFKARLTLDGGEQPITRMRIIRENAAGGRFQAPIHVNVKISFTPVGRPATEALEVRQIVRFPAPANQRWISQPRLDGMKSAGVLLVDTDGDSAPDTFLPGTSNFGVGQALYDKLEQQLACFQPSICHTEDCGQHCVC